ncbi:MAG: sulfatase, partial [Planctomycetales bacterium]|nr:sulfatase [Planctomycetales bacterium]
AEDRWQVRNVANAPRHADALREHRERLDKWIAATGDLGTESAEVYAQEMKDELGFINPKSARYETFRQNVETYKQWAAQGK